MLRFTFFSTFMLFILIGCNSERAELRRIESPNIPFMLQLGNISAPTNHAGNEICTSIADSLKDEGFICAGSTDGDLYRTNPDRSFGTRDALLIKFDRRKKIVWAIQEGTDGPTSEIFRVVKLDSTGDIYACGRWNGSMALRKYSSSGARKWEREYFSGNCGDVLISEDKVYIGGIDTTSNPYSAFLSRVDPSNGDLIFPKWKTAFDPSRTFICSKLAQAPNGDIFCVGATNSKVKISQSPPGSYVDDGTTYYYNDAFIWAFDQDLVSETVFEVIGTANHHESFNTIAISESNQVYVAGYYYGSNISGGGDTDLFPSELNKTFQNMLIYRYDYDGSTLSNQIEFHTSDSQPTTIADIHLKDSSTLVVTGSTRVIDLDEGPAQLNFYDAYAAHFRTSDLSFLRSRRFGERSKGRFDNSNHQYVNASILDGRGNILMSGTTYGSTNEILMGETRTTSGGNIVEPSDIMIWRLGPNLEF